MWYVLTDISEFASELYFAIEVPVGSRENVREVLKLVDVIEVTDFTTLTQQLRDLQSQAMYYHPGTNRTRW